jgi:N-acyl-D-aspartate/D-glutamate deacylase
MATDHADWENLYYDCGGGAGILIAGVVNPELKKYNGKTVAEMAKTENKEELDALFDFVVQDNAQTGALYFMASEEDLTHGLKQPWTSIGLDASESPLDGPLYEPQGHPRAFGSMPRFLGRYVRDQKLMSLTEAIRKITSMPAQRQHLVGRGQIQVGYFADIAIFDPATIIDRATYTESTKLSEGIDTVLVNGQVEFEHGALTGVNAGRALRGPGWKN